MKVYRFILALAIMLLALNTVWAQLSVPDSLSRPATSRNLVAGINLAPPNPLGVSSASGAGVPRGSDIVPFSSGMLSAYMPTIPNLELGFQYYFGDKVSSGQLSGDYLLPYNLGNDSVFFGEAHGNLWNFAKRPKGGASNRVDLSIGGGYRKILSNQVLLGVNGFYDTSRLFNNWYSSGGAGLEMAANVGSSDAIDLNANWYGDLFASNSIINAFRNQGGSYDVEAGYSHGLFNQAMDLRLKFAGYQFDVGNSVYGYKTGADLTTRDGMFTLRYEYGNDRINGAWNNVGAFVNVGFQMENVIKGESPFMAPEPIFKSPRNLRRMLTQKVKRDWNQQYAPGRAAIAAAAVGVGLCRSTDGGEGNFRNPFDPVPWTELDPSLYVTVTFQYENRYFMQYDDIRVVVGVRDETADVRGLVNIPPGSGSLTVGLDSDSQHIFTDYMLDPNRVRFRNSNGDITITNVVICFNQPIRLR